MNRRRVAGITAVLAALIAPAAADAAFPGSNGRIFFDTGGPGRDIVSVDPQGGDRTRVTQGQEPAVSPNGRVIAFIRRGDIYICNKIGGDLLQLTDTPVVERTPSWSPYGNQLVFATDRRNGVGGDIVSIRGDGSDRERLTVSENVDFSPSYSPSGSKIVFVRAFHHPAVRQIIKMDADGSNRVQLTSSNFVSSEHPTWSPDGNRIAFERFVEGSLSLYSIEPDGSDELQLTSGEDNRDREPAFSPSGNKIAYRGQNDDGESGLFVIPALGGPRERLTNPRPSGVDANPYWASTP
jgi:Tol biopolymer transport system component